MGRLAFLTRVTRAFAVSSFARRTSVYVADRLAVLKGDYNTQFWLQGAYSGPVTVSLVCADDQSVLGSAKVDVKSESGSFTQYNTSIPVSKSASDGNNLWTLTFDAATVSDGTLNLGFPLLYGETFKQR